MVGGGVGVEGRARAGEGCGSGSIHVRVLPRTPMPKRSLSPRSAGMKLITAIIRPERLPEVKAALFRAGVTGVTLTRVSGHGGEREVVQRYRAETVVLEFHEKVKVEMACSEPFVEPTIRAIL